VYRCRSYDERATFSWRGKSLGPEMKWWCFEDGMTPSLLSKSQRIPVDRVGIAHIVGVGLMLA
jgi:hypothetical protein